MSNNRDSHAQAVLDRLWDILGCKERDDKGDDLLLEAVTHGSWVQEHPQANRESNQRMEFLGDAVVGLAMVHYLYIRYPQLAEGPLSRVKAAVVGEGALATAARRLGLGSLLFLGKGEEGGGGRDKPGLLADCFEAVVGALFLVSGWEKARDFVCAQLGPVADRILRRGSDDYKSLLQEAVQERGSTVVYHLLGEEGPDHAKMFTVAVLVDGSVVGRGRGRSKKAAEQEAAREALARRGLTQQTSRETSVPATRPSGEDYVP